MNIPNIKIHFPKLESNTVVITAVILITIILMFIPEIKNGELFKLGFTALISWGAGYAMGSKQDKEIPNEQAS